MSKKQRSHGQGTLFRRTPDGPWVAQFYTWDGKRPERSTGTTDKRTAERMLARWVDDEAQRRGGLVDPRADRYADAERRPIAEHVADFRAALSAKGVTRKHEAGTASRVQRVLTLANAERIGELVPSAVQTAIGSLRDGDKGTSLQTCHHYLRAIKEFSRWLYRDGRTPADALAHLPGYNAAKDRRRERRALDGDEQRRLVLAAETGPARRGVAGPDRAMLYRVALGTGFRASELHSLTPESFRLDSDPPAIILAAGRSKRRREDVQPITPDLAKTLRDWLQGKPAGKPVWPGYWHEHAAGMVRGDLRRARARWIRETRDRTARRKRRESEFLADRDAAGKVADFHALRASFITAIVKAGTSPKLAQELARHSDPKLTFNVYTKLGLCDTAAALDGLPLLPAPRTETQSERVALRATGTDNATPPSPVMSAVGAENGGMRQDETERTRSASASAARDGGGEKSLENKPKSKVAVRGRTEQNATLRTAPGVIRTRDLRFRKPPASATSANATDVYAGPECGVGSFAGSLPADTPPDADLAAVVAAWPDLPAEMRAGIAAMVAAATRGRQ